MLPVSDKTANESADPAGSPTPGPSASSIQRSLLLRAAGHTCALNLGDVIEIMRPLPIERIAGAPEVVLGLAVIRGVAVPVVALSTLFRSETAAFTRFVLVRAGGKPVALAVDAVIGLHEFPASDYQAMPPLLRDAARSVVETIAALDSELLFVLNTAGIVPAEFLEPAGLER